MKDFPQIFPMGNRAILINFKPVISPQALSEVIFYKNKIENLEFKQEVQLINTYHSILISYSHTIEDIYDEVLRLKRLFKESNIPKKLNGKLFHLPVCYNPEFGLDLKLISNENKLGINEIIQLHTQPTYQLYFIGFLPGFLYLGGLNKRLEIPRKKTPRKSVEKGAVGIGENQTGIYPKSSPGGWQILGKCPVNLFDKNSNPPSVFSAGDKIKFYSVSREEYFDIQHEIENGNFQLKNEKYAG